MASCNCPVQIALTINPSKDSAKWRTDRINIMVAKGVGLVTIIKEIECHTLRANLRAVLHTSTNTPDWRKVPIQLYMKCSGTSPSVKLTNNSALVNDCYHIEGGDLCHSPYPCSFLRRSRIVSG